MASGEELAVVQDIRKILEHCTYKIASNYRRTDSFVVADRGISWPRCRI